MHEMDPKRKLELEAELAHAKEIGHEEGEINPAPVYKFMLWLGAFMVFSYFLVYGILKMNDARVEKADKAVTHLAKPKSDELPPEPRLQLAPGHPEHPLDEGSRYRDSVAQALETYAYLNKATGSVRIPIDLAKDILLKKGLPERKDMLDDHGIQDGQVWVPDWSSSGRVSVRRDQRIPGGTFTVTGGNLNVSDSMGGRSSQ